MTAEQVTGAEPALAASPRWGELWMLGPLAVGLALGAAAVDVVPGGLVVAGAGQGDDVQGAVELAVRFERMWFDSLGTGEPYRSSRAEFVLPEGEKAFTIGVNWTLNRFVKLQANAIREQARAAADR